MQNKKLLCKIIFLTMLWLFPSPICIAASIHAPLSGEPVQYNNARALGMGALSIVIGDGNWSNHSNPAVLIATSRPTIVGSVHGDWISEQQFSKDTQELDNSQAYLHPLRSHAFIIPYKKKFTCAVSHSLLRDFAFRNEGTNEQNQSTQSKESSGGFYTFSGAIARQIIPVLAIGGSLNLLRGNNDVELRYSLGENIQTDITEQSESGINITFGGLYTPNDKIKIGAMYQTSTDITRKRIERTTEDGYDVEPRATKSKWVYPSSMGIGAAYNSEKLLFVGELHRTNWSDYTIRHGTDQLLIRPNYNNLTTLHFGIEYTTEIPSISDNPVYLRGGFYTEPFHFLEELSTDETSGYFVTAGAGMNWNDIKLEIAGQIGKRTFTYSNPFVEYEESVRSILFTIAYEFDLLDWTPSD